MAKIIQQNFENILNFNQLEKKIHYVYAILEQSESIIQKYYTILPTFEKKQIERYKVKKIRDRQILSKGLLYILLGNYLETKPGNIEFEYNKFGKPFLSGSSKYNKICFNMSHSDIFAVYGFVKERNIGVDVEQIKQISDMSGVVDICFSDSEKKWFNEIPINSKNEIFYKIWTSKEAYIKAIGMGLSFSPEKISTGLNSDGNLIFKNILDEKNSDKWSLRTFTINPHYTSAVVVEDNDPEIEYYSIDPAVIQETF